MAAPQPIGGDRTPQADDAVIEFRNVAYRLPSGTLLLKDLSFSVRRGETLMLLGRSGSGKTTCLKLINRLLTPSSGEVWIEGKSSSAWDAIRLRRGIGYAIQEVGLFPHYTVRQNVALVPRLENWEAARISQRVAEVLQLVGLAGGEFAERFPDQLSGGQRQRVGLARALAADPAILLMDEPFGALDPLTRAEIQFEFKKLQKDMRSTVVFVTHDVSEALLLGDRIALLEEGHLRTVETPEGFVHSADEIAQRYVEIYRTSHLPS